MLRRFQLRRSLAIATLLALVVEAPAQPPESLPPPTEFVDPYPMPADMLGVDLKNQTVADVRAKSTGCVECHKTVHDPHFSPSVKLGCVDCHGGDPTATNKYAAHILPAHPEAWVSAANPVRSYTLLNQERPEFIRFVNPGDLRVAHIACGQCHANETLQVRKSMMTHGCMLWGAALYNNGSVPFKWSRYGESYSMNGAPQRLQTVPRPTAEETAQKGVLPYLDPLPRYQISQPGNVLRIFERGGRFIFDPGIPEIKEEPGRPRGRLSNRGLGTLNRTDPVMIGLQKTRLLDPTLNFLGTNDHPGDFRSSGCTSCHVVYANDRSPVHSGPYAKYGHLGEAAESFDEWVKSVDPTIAKGESGHPIQHRFTNAIPTSQCIVCHTHPGTTVMNTYLGYMWWDMETDGKFMYPEHEHELTAEEYQRKAMSNPNEAAMRGLWSDPEFLANVATLNPKLEHTQFADFNSHGWVYRAVFKKDEKGRLLDHKGKLLEDVDAEQRQLAVAMPEYVKQLYRDRDWDSNDEQVAAELKKKEQALEDLRDDVPVHMLDIHLERGMHCIDCHFVQDMHGNTKLYGEVRAAIEITCKDCHGDARQRAIEMVDGKPSMRTSGPAAADRPGDQPDGRELLALRTPSGKRRFELHGNRLIQNSMVEQDLSWEVTQVRDTIDPESDHYNAMAALAKTARYDDAGNFVWGDVPDDGTPCAHSGEEMSCIACHSAWNASCYGCHLPQKANRKTPDLHNEGDVTRNLVSYNFQTLRDDVYMLARDGNVTGNRIGPSRSSCAIHVTSYNSNREEIYMQQQTISADGPSGIAFSTNVPHTVRGAGETKTCTACHLSADNDNNARMAQLLMQGTNYLNFIGRFCWVAAGEEGLFGVAVTELEEPQAVFGSSLHEMAFPKHYEEHLEHHRKLEEAHEHPGVDPVEKNLMRNRDIRILDLQLRGEFLYAATGEGGLRVFDVAFIDNKAFSERIVTAPVSPVGAQLFVRSKYAQAVAAPSTTAPDPTRKQDPANEEPEIHPIYAYLFVADKYEGLILVNVGTLLDGNPTNNYLKRELTFNPGGLLRGACEVTIVGTYAYVCCDAGLVVVSLDDPKQPKVTCVVGNDRLDCPTDVQVQFRYAFVCDKHGIKTFDVTDLANPIYCASLELEDAKKIYVARSYAYVAAGHQGLVVLDVANPTAPRVDQVYNAGGKICDTHDVKLGITYVSEFAYLADGKNGMHVVQLTSPETPGNDGYSPRPTPQLIATFELPEGEALAISEGVDRDRAVDESGNQISVFGRVGARPLNAAEARRMYEHPQRGLWQVIDGTRDFDIDDKAQRETKLRQELEQFYGRAREFRQGREGPRLPPQDTKRPNPFK